MMDEDDGKIFGQVEDLHLFGRASAPQAVERESYDYNMDHPRAGVCLIFVYYHYHPGSSLPDKSSATKDLRKCKFTFSKLGFDVRIFRNATHMKVKRKLHKVSKEDHSDNDSLVLIWMDNGGCYKFLFERNGKKRKEFICAYDEEFNPEELWKPFTTKACTSLAGKPKLLFIQACRGSESDKGVLILKPQRVIYTPQSMGGDQSGHALFENLKLGSYVIPTHADLLIMWSSYPGHPSFRSGVCGSVFIHFLTKILFEEGFEENLANLLLKVTRHVALDYESNITKEEDLVYNKNKQVPYCESTLMRNVKFSMKHKFNVHCEKEKLSVKDVEKAQDGDKKKKKKEKQNAFSNNLELPLD